MPFRTSGLIPGAKLELVQKSNTPAVVQVALQVPLPEGKEIPGGRLIYKFPSNLTLWTVLRQFESGQGSAGRNINITARGIAQMTSEGQSGSGQLFYETPVLNLMGRELASFSDFQKTLSQLGYNSGSVLIRLSFRKSSQTLVEAMQQISQFFENDELEQEALTAPPFKPDDTNIPSTTKGNTPIDDTSLETPLATGPEQTGEATFPSISTAEDTAVTSPTNVPSADDPYRPVNVYLAPTGDVPAAALISTGEHDFTPTAAHAQLHQARLEKDSRNKRLLSDEELEERAASEAAKVAAVRSVLIKVRFPDNTSSDWQIGPSETGAFLHAAVRHVMADPSQPFKLTLPGSKTFILDEGGPRHSLIKGYKISGRVLISLVWDEKVPLEVRRRAFLKTAVAEEGKVVVVPNIPEPAAEPSSSEVSKPLKPEKRDGGGDGGEKKVPKWFKLGKK